MMQRETVTVMVPVTFFVEDVQAAFGDAEKEMPQNWKQFLKDQAPALGDEFSEYAESVLFQIAIRDDE